MLFHTMKWGWTRLAAGLLLAPLTLNGAIHAAAPVLPRSPITAQPGDPKALLRDARAALEGGDFNRAQDLVQQAEANNPTGKWGGLFEDSPASLRKKIATARQASEKLEVARLLQEARMLLARPANSEAERAANLDHAMKMAGRAEVLHGPDYSVWETGDRPDRLVRDIETALSKVDRSRIPAPPTQASVIHAQEAMKPKAPLRLPPPPIPGNPVIAAAPRPPAPVVQAAGMVNSGGIKMASHEVVEPGGSKSAVPAEMPVAPSAPLLIPPTPPVAASGMPSIPMAPAAPDMNRAAAERLILEAKTYSAKGDFLTARTKLMEADALRVSFGPNEGPGFAMQELNALAVEVKDKLVREVHDCVAKKDFARAEAALGGAEQIAAGLSLAAHDVAQARMALTQAANPMAPAVAAAPLPPLAKPAVGTSPSPLPSMVIAPPMTPDLKTPLPPPTRPVAAAPTVPEDGQLTGRQLLDQAVLELQKGDFAMAGVMARQAYNRGDVKPQAQAMLNQIDAESLNAKKADAEKTFDNAARSFATRDYSMTLGTLALLDPKLLPAEKAVKRKELIDACQAALDGTKTPVQTASAQVPAESTVPPVKMPSFPMGGEAPLMKVDLQPVLPEGTPKIDAGSGKGSEPATDSARQALAMREVLMQKLRDEGLKAMESAQATFGQGDTDVAINILNDYTNRVRASSLDGPRQAMLLKPIDARLSQFRIMRGHVDSLSREKKEKQDAKDILNNRNTAEQQRQAEITRLMRECNVLIKDKKDYAQANRLAMQMKQLDPDNPAIQLVLEQTKVLDRVAQWEKIKDDKEAIVRLGLNQAEQVGPVVSMDNPIKMQLDNVRMHGRRGVDDPYQRSRTPAEFEIDMKLQRPINLSFQQTPLKLAVQNIAEKAQIPVWFDSASINAEGSASLDAPVEADFQLSAHNALSVLLEGVGLSYVIENDLVKITTVKKSKGRLFTKVFSVADLVTPVPNFALPDYANLSKILGKSAIDNPNAVIGGGTTRQAMQGQPVSDGAVKWDPSTGTSGGKLENVPQGGNPAMIGTTNKGFGTQFTGSMTKHEQLIKLVTGMVRPNSWDAGGGNGRIEFYDIGSALVVNQTGDVIREVQDLLEALRRLQDLAVAVEMRIVSLSETFFERMGVDFAVNVQTHNTRFENNLTGGGSGNSIFRPDPFLNTMNGYNATVGLTPAGTFTPDLNVPVKATSFNYAIPSFGNYPNAPGANGGVSLGLAFLNDIQVYMFMEAAQGDRRQNIMQAPKITLFNGQTATISITDFAYFVTSVQVFSVNGQIVFVPQNTPLPIGTQGSLGGQIGVQAVVSADRRFVRITPTLSLQTISGALTPLFPVTTFITPVFEGGSQGQPIPFTQFLQQPSLSTIDVQTTVVCPDGGTVLMGGFKYLAEGRNEFGPPFLSKIPYLNRLFKNVGIGRETRHLMLMITPRIIITAEEELIQTEGVRFPGQNP